MIQKFFCISALISAMVSPSAFAQFSTKERVKSEGAKAADTESAVSDISKLNYPELEVTPRASDRLEREARRESRNAWGTYLPIQLSALATYYAGTATDPDGDLSSQKQSDFESLQTLATGLGAGWLALTGIMMATYQPYRNGYQEIRGVEGKSARDQLTRERLAEEALYAPDQVGNRLKWFSFATNFMVTGALTMYSDASSQKFGILGMAAAFAPLIFEFRWSRIANTHRDYKKKIYGPLSYAPTVLPSVVPERDGIRTGFNLVWAL